MVSSAPYFPHLWGEAECGGTEHAPLPCEGRGLEDVGDAMGKRILPPEDQQCECDGSRWIDVHDAHETERKLEAETERRAACYPELLAALKATTAWIVKLTESGDGGFWEVEDMDCYQQARAAIKKAEEVP